MRLHFLHSLTAFMQMMNKHFQCKLKYEQIRNDLLRKHIENLKSTNFDDGFFLAPLVEKPVETVNNFSYIPVIMGLWKRFE